jgi:hypothetical protein
MTFWLVKQNRPILEGTRLIIRTETVSFTEAWGIPELTSHPVPEAVLPTSPDLGS